MNEHEQEIANGNEIEWRRLILKAWDDVNKKLDQNAQEHSQIITEITIIKSKDVDKALGTQDQKIKDHVEAGSKWRFLMATQILGVLILTGSFIFNWGTTNNQLKHLTDNQIQVMKDVSDLKLTSIGYREFKRMNSNDEIKREIV